MMNPKITIFTPTYNRAYILPRLYESLLKQTSKNFEWIVVDDGSTDQTKSLFEGYLQENKIPIKFFLQENSGKHVAVNKGIGNALGSFFFVLDSDDYLLENAVEEVLTLIQKIENNPKVAGVTFIRAAENQNLDFYERQGEQTICNNFDFIYHYRFTGEMTFVIRTEILQKNLYPQFAGEKFCPESLVYKRIAKDFDYLFYIQVLALGDYLPDGLTSKYWQLIQKSPKTCMIFYEELLKNPKIPEQTKKNAAKIFIELAFSQPKKELLKNLGRIPNRYRISAIKNKFLKKWNKK